MTAKRLEVKIININRRVLGHLILTEVGRKNIKLEGDFLSKGIYCMDIEEIKKMISLKAKEKYHTGYKIKYIPIIYHTQNEMVPK